MELETVLRDRIKPELNFLFTEPPVMRNGGLDFGWFCREHAYLGYFVCRLLGHEPKICIGDVSLSDQQGEPVLSSVNVDSDHAWLALEKIIPVDLSIVVKYLPQTLPKLGLVYGVGTEGDYSVTCGDGKVGPAGTLHLHYGTAEQLTLSDQQLLNDPFRLLHRPTDGGLPKMLGADIYTKIAWHLYRVAIGEIGPYRQYIKTQLEALKRIGKKNPDAAEMVRAKLLIGDKA